jgi:hypothetical protein
MNFCSNFAGRLPSMRTYFWMLALVISSVLWLPAAAQSAEPLLPLFAQAPAPVAAPAAQSAKSWIFESILVGLLFAAALFAVCRTSRRI